MMMMMMMMMKRAIFQNWLLDQEKRGILYVEDACVYHLSNTKSHIVFVRLGCDGAFFVRILRRFGTACRSHHQV
jgi:hypothetical protein